MCLYLASAVDQRHSTDRGHRSWQLAQRAVRSGAGEVCRRVRRCATIDRVQRSSFESLRLASQTLYIIIFVKGEGQAQQRDNRRRYWRRFVLRVTRVDLVCAWFTTVWLESHRIETSRTSNEATRQTGTCKKRKNEDFSNNFFFSCERRVNYRYCSCWEMK